MQIKNLSAAQVQPFGEILSAESELLPPCAERWQIRPGADVRELRADGPVVLDYVSGMPLLVIYEKDARSVYYLDRVLALRPGVRFSIAALGSGCEVDCRARQPGLVQLLACHPAEEFSGTGSELKLERLYTFFYQECASDFYFRGEQHEAFELVYVDRGELHNLAGGADVLLRQQQLMLIGRNVWHMQYADRPVSFLTVSFRAAELPCSRLTGRALSLTARQIGLVRQMLEAHGAESYAYDCVESLLKLLLADLLRGLDRQPSADAAQPLPATSHTERRIVDRLVQLISARAGEKLSLQALADEAHISTTYLHSARYLAGGVYRKDPDRGKQAPAARRSAVHGRDRKKARLFQPAALFPSVPHRHGHDAVRIRAQPALTGGDALRRSPDLTVVFFCAARHNTLYIILEREFFLWNPSVGISKRSSGAV